MPTQRGLDLPSLPLASDSARLTTTEGVAALAAATHGGADARHRCVGFIRNVVPHPDATYPHPVPWAHVPVFTPADAVVPHRHGTWLTLAGARPALATRHWWPIVEHHLAGGVS